MKKIFIVLTVCLLTTVFGAASSEAHQGAHRSSVKGAVRELHEAKEILGKVTPDAEGHVAKAAQAVDQALQELSAVKTNVAKP